MAYWFENECCGCATDNYPCLGKYCTLRKVAYFKCDFCGEEKEPSELYAYTTKEDGDRDLCWECYAEQLKDDAVTIEQQIENGQYWDEQNCCY